jgi:hypothetical protein
MHAFTSTEYERHPAWCYGRKKRAPTNLSYVYNHVSHGSDALIREYCDNSEFFNHITASDITSISFDNLCDNLADAP